MATTPAVQVKRVYATADADDGTRVLVDRLWPRGVSKDRAALDEWLKRVAPSPELRKWYAHDPEKFEEFASRYRQELTDGEQREALARLREWAARGPLTLLTASKRDDISEATVLQQVLTESG